MRVLLHTCCGPCASACVPALRELGHEVSLFYSNSNIDTREEFEKRLENARKLAEADGAELAADGYDHADWLEKVAKGFEGEPEKERQEGTDPYDSGNFRLVATVNVESSDVVPGLTNFVAWGYLPAGWETNDLAAFAGNSLPFPVDGVATNGELYVKVFRDFNANGVYDAGVDALVLKKLIRTDNGKTVTFRIGDSDNDRIADSVELDEGTNPFDRSNYCFSLSQTYTGVFQTTNALTFAAYFGTNRVYGPCVVADRVWTHDFGHCVAANGEKVSVSVWDDANHNGEWDEGETINMYVTAITGHDMVVTNALTYGNFDHDGNTLPDWWEEVTGLNMVTNGGPFVDTDGDGLINIHELWAGTDPMVPDGSNTLLSVISRAIDDCIRERSPIDALNKFDNYHVNGSNWVFVLNSNCWANSIDTSCASIWNSYSKNFRAGTAVSRRHVLVATHYPLGAGVDLVFCGTDGNICTNRIIGSTPVTGIDITVALLQDELPNNITPASILPANYECYLGNATALPCFFINQNECACVQEIFDLKTRPIGNRAALQVSGLYPICGERSSFYKNVIDRDSGSPRFISVAGKSVLLNLIWYGPDSPGYGSFITLYKDYIQSAMDALCPGYQLNELDMTDYQPLQ